MCIEADLEECIQVAGKKPIGVRCVDAQRLLGLQEQAVAKEFKSTSRVDVEEELYVATLPLELVKLSLWVGAS